MPASNVHLRARKRPEEQLSALEQTLREAGLNTFSESITQAGWDFLDVAPLETLQLNLGKMCNQTCKHCHVDAGPTRKEIMTKETIEACLRAAETLKPKQVDLTGGAPEMNPHFRWLVEELSARNIHVIVRCNLTILLANAKYADLPTFYAKHKVEVISSLPHFMARRTDAQRGDGVFAQSIEALRRLQAQGYGKPGSSLLLKLVYNPTGAFLPGSQNELEREFKHQMWRRYKLHFHNLIVITNMPIARFFDYLDDSGNLNDYMKELVNNFNPDTLKGLMCRNTLSVGWDGNLYDCDFNQMLDIEVASHVRHISQVDAAALQKRRICTDEHCYGCTAGAGSSCGGSLA